jgi:phosphohistidine phosphatase SixA
MKDIMINICRLGHVHRHLLNTGQWLVVLFALTFMLVPESNHLKADRQTIWIALRSGDHFAVLRHAIAPGTGDPENFKIGDCSTQRNLSDAGRKQAAHIGERFRANGIDKARVLSSQWCRCLETANLLSLGPVTALPALNSFFEYFEREKQQTQQLTEWLDRQDFKEPLVLVTHQVNITALTGVFPASGEMLVLKRSKKGEYMVVGRIDFQAEQ